MKQPVHTQRSACSLFLYNRSQWLSLVSHEEESMLSSTTQQLNTLRPGQPCPTASAHSVLDHHHVSIAGTDTPDTHSHTQRALQHSLSAGVGGSTLEERMHGPKLRLS